VFQLVLIVIKFWVIQDFNKEKKFLYVAVVEPSPLLLRPFIGLLYLPWMIDGDECGTISGMNVWQRKPKKTCPGVPLSTTDPT
jgi:hypothetical protein